MDEQKNLLNADAFLGRGWRSVDVARYMEVSNRTSRKACAYCSAHRRASV